MAVYSIGTVSLSELSDRTLTFDFEVMKDAAVLQNVSLSVKRTNDASEIARQIGDSAKNIAIKDHAATDLTAEVQSILEGKTLEL